MNDFPVSTHQSYDNRPRFPACLGAGCARISPTGERGRDWADVNKYIMPPAMVRDDRSVSGTCRTGRYALGIGDFGNDISRNWKWVSRLFGDGKGSTIVFYPCVLSRGTRRKNRDRAAGGMDFALVGKASGSVAMAG